MSQANNYVDNGTVAATGNALPSAKSNVSGAPALPAANSLSANDINTIQGALPDLKAVLNRTVSIMSYGADNSGATDCSAAFAQAIAALPAGGVIHLPSAGPGAATYRLSSNLAIPANTTLDFDAAAISVDSSYTLTINGAVVAATGQQIFSGAGAVSLQGKGTVSACWFGATGNGTTDDTAALNLAITSVFYVESTSGSIVAGSIQRLFIPKGIYKVSSAITLPSFADILGEQAILLGVNASANIFNIPGYRAKVEGVIFQGGLNALYLSNADTDPDNCWITKCEFDNQNGAAVSDAGNVSSTLATFDNCLFYQDVSGAAAMALTSLRVYCRNCQFYWGTQTCFSVAGQVFLKVTDCDGIPLGGTNTQWINVTTAATNPQLYFEKFRFGGENPCVICVWSAAVASGTEPGVLSVIRCEVYSGSSNNYILHSMPATLCIEQNTGLGANGILFATNISDTAIATSPTYRRDIEQELELGQGGYASFTDRIVALLDRRHPADRSPSGQPHVADVVLTSPGSLVQQQGTPVNVTVTTTTNPYGGTLSVGTSTAAAANAVFEWGNASAPPLASLTAGLYTAAMEIELSGPASIETVVGDAQRLNMLSSGRHVLCVPFVVDPLWVSPTAWATAVTETVGNYVVNFGIIFKCVAVTGDAKTAATGTGPAVDNPGNTIVDNHVTWLCMGNQLVLVQWYPVASGSVIRVGALRVLSGRFDIKSVNTEALAAAAPTTGTWQVGDVVINTAPAAGGNLGWVCVTAGAPGTWKQYGPISN